MKMFTKFAVAALTCAFGAGAMAQDSAPADTTADTSSGSSLKPGGLFIEPMITYQTGDNSVQTSQLPIITDDTSGKISGFGAGARIGAHVSEIIFLAADLRFVQLNMKDSFYGNTNGQAYNYGLTAGAQMPWYGLRGWATYVAGGMYDPNAGTTTPAINAKAEDAKGYRVGAGIKLMNFSVNLEYEDLKYDKTKITNAGVFATNIDSNVDFKTRSWILGVSFPFAL